MFILRALSAFLPAGMTKNGTFTLSATAYTQVTGWLADTTNYPGSTLSGDDLVAQAAGTGKTISASVLWSNSSGFTRTAQMQLKLNGSIIATGPAVSVPNGGSATATVSATNQTVAQGDLIRLEAQKDFGTGNPTAGTNTSSYVRVE